LNVRFSYDFFLELVHIQTTNTIIYIYSRLPKYYHMQSTISNKRVQMVIRMTSYLFIKQQCFMFIINAQHIKHVKENSRKMQQYKTKTSVLLNLKMDQHICQLLISYFNNIINLDPYIKAHMTHASFFLLKHKVSK